LSSLHGVTPYSCRLHNCRGKFPWRADLPPPAAFNMPLLVASVKSCAARLADDDLRLEDDMPTPGERAKPVFSGRPGQLGRHPSSAIATPIRCADSDRIRSDRPLSALDIVLTEVPVKAATSRTSGGQPWPLPARRSFQSIDRETLPLYQFINLKTSGQALERTALWRRQSLQPTRDVGCSWPFEPEQGMNSRFWRYPSVPPMAASRRTPDLRWRPLWTRDTAQLRPPRSRVGKKCRGPNRCSGSTLSDGAFVAILTIRGSCSEGRDECQTLAGPGDESRFERLAPFS
jgi:hypothetical protein